MPEETTNILIEYEDNCHYNGSFVEKKIVIPSQNILGHIDIVDFRTVLHVQIHAGSGDDILRGIL